MANTSKRVAANRANARRSTGPKTPEGKARAAQNARKHRFNPDPFAIVRMEDRAQIAALVADAVATYQPINSQERLAVERIALAQHSMLRMYALEAGFFTNCFDQAMCGPKEPDVLQRSEISQGIETTLAQNRAFWLAYGLNIFNRQSNIASTFLRFQAQAERLYRRAVEDFHRLLKLRGQLPPEKYEVPNEPNIEPTPEPQPTANTAAPAIPQPVAQTPNEPNAKPSPPPVTAPRREPHAKDNPRPALVPQSSQPPRRRHAANPPGASRSLVRPPLSVNRSASTARRSLRGKTLGCRPSPERGSVVFCDTSNRFAPDNGRRGGEACRCSAGETAAIPKTAGTGDHRWHTSARKLFLQGAVTPASDE